MASLRILPATAQHLERAAAYRQKWARIRGLSPVTTSVPLVPAQGVLNPVVSVHFPHNPDGTARIESDFPPGQSMRQAMERQAQVIRDKLNGLEDRTGVDEACEMLHIPVNSSESMEVVFVNMVHSNYYTTDPRPTGQQQQQQRKPGDHCDEDEESVIEPKSRKKNRKPGQPGPVAPVPLYTLRWLQRRWVPLGFHRNQVGTAIGVRYIRPYGSSHLCFPQRRILTTGPRHRRVDRILLCHGTCAFLEAAGLEGARIQKRVSQNIVTRGTLPTQHGICLPLFMARNRSITELTKKFIGVKISGLPELGGATMLAFRRRAVVCVATKTLDHVYRVYQHMEPMLRRYYRSPEVEAEEAEERRRGTLPVI